MMMPARFDVAAVSTAAPTKSTIQAAMVFWQRVRGGVHRYINKTLCNPQYEATRALRLAAGMDRVLPQSMRAPPN